MGQIQVDDWLLEHDSEDEIYTEPTIDESLIQRDLGLFDGTNTFYCALYNSRDESCLWCIGEPDRRIIEARLVTDGKLSHFVLRSVKNDDHSPATIRTSVRPADVLNVKAAEVLTAAEAIEIFLTFFRTKTIHHEFAALPKSTGLFSG